MDELAVGPDGMGNWDGVTTSHPGESVSDVVNFAKAWSSDDSGEVQLIEI